MRCAIQRQRSKSELIVRLLTLYEQNAPRAEHEQKYGQISCIRLPRMDTVLE